MAFYRVTIWMEDGKEVAGISECDNQNVDFATNYFRMKAAQHYPKMVDIEAALLSNHCTAVREFIARKEAKRKREKDQKRFGSSSNYVSKSRKSEPEIKLTLQERMDRKRENDRQNGSG